MKKILRNTLTVFAILSLFGNAAAQNRQINNSITAMDPVFPSIAVNPASPIFEANDVTYLNKDTAVAVGAAGMTWRSIDGGLNWTSIATFTSTNNNNGVIMKGNYICIAGDLGTVSFSSDKGASWQNSAQAQPLINYHDVHFADTTYGVSVGDYGDAVVYKWVGGLGWAHIPTGLNPKLNAVAAYKTSPSVFQDGFAIALGDSGVMATYAFGSWTILPQTVTTNLNGVYLFSDNVTVIAVGDSGLIMRSPDFGNTWSILNSGTNENLHDISDGIVPNQMIAVGDSGIIYVSKDGGLSFNRFTVGFNSTNLKGVSAKDPKGSFGGSGNVLRTFVTDTLDITYVGDSLLCPGDNFKTAINLKGQYGANNLVSLELSDSAGSFTTPVVIGTKLNPLLPNDSITGTIPANAKPSLLYKLRLSASDPQIVSNEHPITLTVYPKPNAVTVMVSTTDLYVNFQTGCTYQWYYNAVSMGGQIDTIVTTVGNGNYYVVITNANGCSISSNVFNYNSTSVNAFANNAQVVVSPNPASNTLNVRVPADFANKTIRIYNTLGAKVFSENVKAGNNHINISELESGIYFLTIDSFTKKIVVVK